MPPAGLERALEIGREMEAQARGEAPPPSSPSRAPFPSAPAPASTPPPAFTPPPAPVEPTLYRDMLQSGSPVDGLTVWRHLVRQLAAAETGQPIPVYQTLKGEWDAWEKLLVPIQAEASPATFIPLGVTPSGVRLYAAPELSPTIYTPQAGKYGTEMVPLKSDSIPDWANTLVDILHKVGGVALTAVGGGAAVPLIEELWKAAGFDVKGLPGVKLT